MDQSLVSLLEQICISISDAGLDPWEQLTGYLRTGNDRYITRNGNARELIKGIDRKTLKQYAAWLKSKK